VIGVPDAASGEAVKAFVVRGDPALDAETVRDLSHADVGIGEHCLGGLDVVLREFRRTASICEPMSGLDRTSSFQGKGAKVWKWRIAVTAS